MMVPGITCDNGLRNWGYVIGDEQLDWEACVKGRVQHDRIHHQNQLQQWIT